MNTIVGIDAGVNTGYAIIDLQGRLIACGVEKEASDERMVGIISSFGVPVLVASDTSPPSHFVQKIAARLNIRVFHPKESLKKEEKRLIGPQISNAHARDSYAAAVKAYRRFQNRLRQIDGMPVPNKDELKGMIIKGQRIYEKTLRIND